jgi:hypothetical protein
MARRDSKTNRSVSRQINLYGGGRRRSDATVRLSLTAESRRLSSTDRRREYETQEGRYRVKQAASQPRAWSGASQEWIAYDAFAEASADGRPYITGGRPIVARGRLRDIRRQLAAL